MNTLDIFIAIGLFFLAINLFIREKKLHDASHSRPFHYGDSVDD